MGTEKTIEVIEAIKKVNEDLDAEKNAHAWAELNSCQPFSLYEDRLEALEAQIAELRQSLSVLRKHQHTKNGKPCLVL